MIQSSESYKLDLLQRMIGGENMQKFADLVVFCNDGVAWTSKLLMSAASEMVREAFSQLDVLQGETTSIVLPDITKQEFNIFCVNPDCTKPSYSWPWKVFSDKKCKSCKL